jgi:hypothetical protein
VEIAGWLGVTFETSFLSPQAVEIPLIVEFEYLATHV